MTATLFGALLVGDELNDWRGYLDTVDSLGFWGLGVGDSQSLYTDTYVRCGLAAVGTQRPRIGPLVTNPVTRHPAVTASAIATVDQLSLGRAFLGIGAGDSAVLNIGENRSRMAVLEEYITAVSDLMENGTATWEGHTIRCSVPRRRVPIYVAAAGHGSMRLAGRIADGVVLGTGLSPEAVRDAVDTVHAGAREAGRRPEDIDLWWLVMANLSEDGAEARRELENSLTTHAHATFAGGVAGKGVPERFHEAIEKINADYNPMQHAKFGGRHHRGLVDDPDLLTYLADRFALCGSPDEVVAQVQRAAAAGVHKIWLSIRVPDKRRVLRLWHESVQPALATS
jgi:5,10-methylenetetrahydromethanopterin reductase